MKPKLVSPIIAKGLAFLRLLNEQRAYPTEAAVNEFARTTTMQSQYTLDETFWVTDQDPTVTAYLARVGFTVQTRDGLSLTRTGFAFARGLAQMDRMAQTPDADSAPIEVVGRLDDAFTYARLLAQIDAIDEAFIIDPYLAPPELSSLLQLPRVRRVLTKRAPVTGRRKLTADDRTTQLQIHLGANPAVELRLLPPEKRELHDRLVLPPHGPGLIIGTSLGGSQLTVVTSLGEDSTAQLRAHYDELWSESEAVEPIARPEAEEVSATADAVAGSRKTTN